MRNIRNYLYIHFLFMLIPSLSLALGSALPAAPPVPKSPTAIEKRSVKEDKVLSNPFAITFYKQNYILPFYYTGSPYNKIYIGNTPNREQLKNSEIKYQLSLKLPVWKDIFKTNNSLYFAYTQLSYWQAYNKTAFFRETDYQPELFLSNEINWLLNPNWAINTFNIGVTHESNGFGDSQERSWNRIYLEAILSSPQMMISLKPWYVFHDATYNKFNPDMAKYLGYGEITWACKFLKQVATLQTHGLIEHHARYLTVIATYSFPLTTYMNGFIQGFSGYGQSLIEYNHRTNSIGIGIAINNLI